MPIKIIFFIIIVICTVIALGSGLFLKKDTGKNSTPTNLRLIVRIRLVCFLIILVLILLCLFIR